MMVLRGISFVLRDAWWPSGRASDSVARGRGSILTHVLKYDAFTSQKVIGNIQGAVTPSRHN